jgi:cellulose 1,4-beta-cellobiosidase
MRVCATAAYVGLMDHRRPVLAAVAALLLAFGSALAVLAGSPAARAATTSLCQEQTASVAGGTYVVQNNEYDSGASECVTTDGNADFTVANSSIANATNGSPGSYPSIYQGCHWGNCSTGGLTSTPVQVSKLTSGAVTTSWSTSQSASGAYDVAYDIWFNQTPTTTGQPNGTEIMVWLNHSGSVQPFGSVVASNVSLGGHTYNVWYGTQSSWDTVTYDMTSPATSVSNLDIGTLAQDSVSRGYTKSSWYLIDVEAGFELWQGGAGLATSSFSVNVNGGGSGGPPPPPPTSSCSAAYSVTNSWAGGFQGQVVVKNTGSGTLNGWQLKWTFPGNQKISSLWNGGYAQSGSNVTVTNTAYNGSLAPGATATVGFTATYSGTNSAPSAVACTT